MSEPVSSPPSSATQPPASMGSALASGAPPGVNMPQKRIAKKVDPRIAAVKQGPANQQYWDSATYEVERQKKGGAAGPVNASQLREQAQHAKHLGM